MVIFHYDVISLIIVLNLTLRNKIVKKLNKGHFVNLNRYIALDDGGGW